MAIEFFFSQPAYMLDILHRRLRASRAISISIQLGVGKTPTPLVTTLHSPEGDTPGRPVLLLVLDVDVLSIDYAFVFLLLGLLAFRRPAPSEHPGLRRQPHWPCTAPRPACGLPASACRWPRASLPTLASLPASSWHRPAPTSTSVLSAACTFSPLSFSIFSML